MADTTQQLDLFELALQADTEAAAAAGLGATSRLVSSSRGDAPYVAGGPDHSVPWRNPAVEDGRVVPTGSGPVRAS
jgi:hypothetical protein